jgi:hypothetical protein
MVALSVIIRLAGATVKFSTISKIHKYRRLQKGHHFILMAMEVHDTTGCDMNHFIKECARLFHNRQSRGHLSLFFCIQFFTQHVSIALQHALPFTIERKIALAGDVCSRPPTTIRSNDLHVSDIKRAMGEIASYHEKD